MPRVSIVVPTYNHAQYIGQALNSVFEQTYKDFEVIVIDDGSTDNTRGAIQPFSNNLRYIYQKNSGRGAARQRGVEESHAEFIAFLDSDDIWFPRKLERQISYIQENGFSGLLHTKVIFITEDGISRRKNRAYDKMYRHANKSGFSYVSLLYCCPLFMSSVVIPKGLILEAGGFSSNFWVLEDLDFVLRLVKISGIKLLDEQLVWHRDHTRNAATVMKRDVEQTYLSIYKGQLSSLSNIVNEEEKAKAEKHIYNHLITYSYALKDRHTASIYLKELIRKQPGQLLCTRGFKNILKLFLIPG
jgi:glycosyltransferase involved in cell wall biosynthesis